MKSKEVIQQDEERIRQLVRELPDDKKSLFFQQTANNLKDPDTYATLNFLFIAGLHHFYLGNWILGLINITIFFTGVLFLFTGLATLGILILIAISTIELKALFKAQLIVQDYNNGIMEAIYLEISKP